MRFEFSENFQSFVSFGLLIHELEISDKDLNCVFYLSLLGMGKQSMAFEHLLSNQKIAQKQVIRC